MISTAEWQIMRTVWANQSISASCIHQLLGEEFEWSLSTVKTLLGRLVKKGYLNTVKVQREFHYTACVSQQDVVLDKQRELLTQVCTKQQGDFLQMILKEVPLSKQNAQNIIDLLEKRMESLPDQVACGCIKGQCTCHVTI